MNNYCHICNSETSFFMRKGNYNLSKCPSCGLVFMSPLPQAGFLKDKVYSYDSGYQANKVQDLSHIKEDKKTFDILTFITNNIQNGKLLDVGCSNGEFIFHAKNKGLEVYGVELNERTANIAISNGLNVYKGLLDDAHFESNFFDIIFLGDVIEHVLSPRKFVEECHRILKKGGLIIISTPNLDCAWSEATLFLYKLFSIPYSSVTPPHHTFQFSENNLDLLMSQNQLNKVTSWFYKQPRLMYELGSLHLLKRYKQHRNISRLIFMLFSFISYTILYYVISPTRFLRKKDFSMIAIYKKDE